MARTTSHCLTVDVESFIEGMEESFAIPNSYYDSKAELDEVERNVAAILDGFAECGWKATFFVLGHLAEKLPRMISRIVAAGHELGSHGHRHRRLFNLSRAELHSSIRRAKRSLEDVSSCPVFGFRAPDFSIRADNRWALDILLEEGFRYDASLTPTNIHDVYGLKDVLPTAHRLDNGLWEYPQATFRVGARIVPFAGGGYFRLFPIAVTRRLLSASATPVMMYLHPYELGPQAPTIRPLSLARRFRHYYHVQNGLKRLKRVLDGWNVDTAAGTLQAQGMMTD